jgi:hypothetical protein
VPTPPVAEVHLYLPKPVHVALKKAAAENVRTLHGEIVARLTASVKGEK